jgi:hypothetical protein
MEPAHDYYRTMIRPYHTSPQQWHRHNIPSMLRCIPFLSVREYVAKGFSLWLRTRSLAPSAFYEYYGYLKAPRRRLSGRESENVDTRKGSPAHYCSIPVETGCALPPTIQGPRTDVNIRQPGITWVNRNIAGLRVLSGTSLLKLFFFSFLKASVLS